MSSLKKFLKNKAAVAHEAIDQEYATAKCLNCQTLRREIEQHHPEVKSVTNTVYIILKCPTCKHKLNAIIQCAKSGHLIPKEE